MPELHVFALFHGEWHRATEDGWFRQYDGAKAACGQQTCHATAFELTSEPVPRSDRHNVPLCTECFRNRDRSPHAR